MDETDSDSQIADDCYNEYVIELCRIGDEIQVLHFHGEEINSKDTNSSHDNFHTFLSAAVFGLVCLFIFWKI